jgi:uncharacterized protein (DUF302 family)
MFEGLGMGRVGRCAATLLILALGVGAAGAEDVRTYTKRADFDAVKFELTNAIIARGLKIAYSGEIGSMLERTGADVGSSEPLYVRAEFVVFCSARLSRALMEADLTNIGFCPFVVFIYEAAARPGETVVGYRRPPLTQSGDSARVLAEIDTLLDGIVRDASQ